jgi:hypothetical protein
MQGGDANELRELVRELYDALEEAELDRDVLKCKLSGNWEGYRVTDNLVVPDWRSC